MVRARAITTPKHMKRLLLAIQDNVRKYEERFGATGETLSVHARIGVRMPAAKFPADRFPRPEADGTPRSIVLREYGTNGSTQVLVETSLGRLILNDAMPEDFPFIDHVMKKRDITESVSELVTFYDKAVVVSDTALPYWSVPVSVTVRPAMPSSPQR